MIGIAVKAQDQRDRYLSAHPECGDWRRSTPGDDHMCVIADCHPEGWVKKSLTFLADGRVWIFESDGITPRETETDIDQLVRASGH